MNHSYFVIHREPLVCYLESPWLFPTDQFKSQVPAVLIAKCRRFKSITDIEKAITWAKEYSYDNVGSYVDFLCADKSQVDSIIGMGYHQARYCHYAALADDRVFCINENSETPYSAVYNCRPSAVRNFDLCRELPAPWAWIGQSQTNDEFNFLRQQMAFDNACLCSDGCWLPPQEIASIIQQSVSGLALSHTGLSRACAEYLLCGKPIVQIQNCSTRAAFIPNSAALCVDIEPKLVSTAVDFWRGAKVNPEKIRASTLVQMEPHRLEFIKSVRQAYKWLRIKRDPACDLWHLQRHLFLLWQPIESMFSGGGSENVELLTLADQEPIKEKLWVKSEKSWELAGLESLK